MKKLAVIFLFLSVSLSLQAQQPVDLTQKRLDSIEKAIQDGNYVRIPNKDFEEIIDAKVSSSIREEIKNWLWIIVSFFGALMTLLTFYLNRKLKDEVNASMDAKSKNLDTSILGLTSILNEQKKKISIVEEKISNSMDMFWDEMAGLIVEKAKDVTNLNADLEKKIKHFLEYDHVTLSPARQVQLIDALMRTLYYSKEKDNYKKMVKLIKQYEDKFDLEPMTYANAAIAHSNIYELHGMEDDRNNSLDNCDKSLNRSKDYGLPYAIKMEIFMIDYVKSVDESQKKNALDNLKKIFRTIENNQSTVVPVDIVDRMEIDRKVAYLKPYFVQLEKMFASDLDRIRERALDYLLGNYNATVKNEVDKKTLNNIFEYGLNTNFTIIDGNWHNIETITAGTRDGLRSGYSSMNIVTNTYDSTDELGNGFIFFLTGNKPLALNFYKKTDVTFTRIQAIYQLNGDELDICYDPTGSVRPTDFISDQVNNFTLLQFERVQVPIVKENPSILKKMN